jgi:hypothetical protein
MDRQHHLRQRADQQVRLDQKKLDCGSARPVASSSAHIDKGLLMANNGYEFAGAARTCGVGAYQRCR